MIYKQILLEEEEEEKVKVNFIGKNLNEKKNVLRQKRKERKKRNPEWMLKMLDPGLWWWVMTMT